VVAAKLNSSSNVQKYVIVCAQVYEGVTDCSEKNAGIRHLNYSASTAYLLIMMFRHLGGVTVKQVCRHMH
jgi:hypothetical protein